MYILVCGEGWRHVPKRLLTIEQVLTMLAETPPRNAALTAGLAPAWQLGKNVLDTIFAVCPLVTFSFGRKYARC